jgi:predicted oxidoreductase
VAKPHRILDPAHGPLVAVRLNKAVPTVMPAIAGC